MTQAFLWLASILTMLWTRLIVPGRLYGKMAVSQMTFGYELELGDVLRSRAVPERYGSWEYAETDIVNLYPPYKNVATDPLGREPPVGGEINITPGRSPEQVAARVSSTIEWSQAQGDRPSASCVNHGHVHVRVPGLRDDIVKLKKLTRWIGDNQVYLIKTLYGYEEQPLMACTKTARTYLKWDGGRPMPDWMVNNICRDASSFDDFIRIQCCGKDGRSMGRPLRYAINTYCLKHIDTVEFRLFRASMAHEEIEGSLKLVEAFMRAALTNGTPAKFIVEDTHLSWPSFFYHHDSYVGWEATKWPKERGKKERRLLDVTS